MTTKKTSTAEMLTRRINSTTPKPDPVVADPFAAGVAKRLEQRGIAKVPGVRSEAPELEWYDYAIEAQRRNGALEARRKAQRQADDNARTTPQSTAGALAAAITAQANNSVPSGHIPLNGAAVLRAALAGGNGTINSEITVGRNE